MKKTYIIPEVASVLMATEALIATSLEKGSNTIQNSDDILVKGQDNSRGETYDVWSDDWSK